MKWIKYTLVGVLVVVLSPIWLPAILIAFEPSEWKEYFFGRTQDL